MRTDRRVKSRGDLRSQGPRGGGGAPRRTGASVGRLARDREIERGAEAEEIGAGIHRVGIARSGRHVADGAELRRNA